MRWLRRLASRIRATTTPARREESDRELAEELDAHLAIAADEFIRRGMSPDDARRAAVIASGGIEIAKDAYRDQRGLPLADAMMRDATFALRSFRKNPGFAVTVILTLALSIGATTAMFSVVKGLLLDPLPFANAGRLVWTVNHGTRPYDAMSPADLTDWGSSNDTFEQVGAWLTSAVDLVGGVTPTHLTAAEVTGNWFTMLGAPMTLGNGFVTTDQGIGRPKIVVLSHALWQAQFGSDLNIIGTTVMLDGTRHTVVGVAGAGFRFPDDVDIWRPVVDDPRKATLRGSRIFNGPVALLKRGVTFDHAQRQARLVAARLRSLYPQAETGLDYSIQPLREHIVGGSRQLVIVLFGAVALLLLIACANVATLFLVRTSSRTSEIGVRLALGASSRRVTGQLLVESMMLSAVGAAMGLTFAALALRLMSLWPNVPLPLVSSLQLDWPVLAFAVGVMALAALAFGVAPALQAGRIDIIDTLKSGGRASSARKASSSVRQSLVVLEIVLVLPLLVGAVLLGDSFERLVHVEPGFDATHVVRFDIALPRCGGTWSPDTTCAGVEGSRYMTQAAVQGFADELVQRLRALPGTRHVAIAFGVPFTQWAKNQGTIAVEGHTPPPADRPNIVEVKNVSADYFSTLRVPLLNGRGFTDDDRSGAAPVAIISERAAKAYFEDDDPIGKRINIYGEVATVIGVVGDTRTQSLTDASEPAVYRPFRQSAIPYMTVLMRSDAELGNAMAAARAQVSAIDRAVPIFHMMRLRDAIEESIAPAKLAVRVVSAFAVAALLLAMIGIYGVVAYSVRERQREIGIRLALGARQLQIVRLVVRQAMMLSVGGIIIGVMVALAGSRVLQGMLYDVAPTDPASYIVTSLALMVIVLAAAWLPGRRAARVDPLIAMRPD